MEKPFGKKDCLVKQACFKLKKKNTKKKSSNLRLKTESRKREKKWINRISVSMKREVAC